MFTCGIIEDAFVIETERLALRSPRLADAAAIACLAGDKAVAEMTAQIPHPYPPGLAEQFVSMARAGNAAGQHLVLVAAFRHTPDEIIGAFGVAPDREASLPSVGYWLGTPFWGLGLATEALRGLIDTLFARSDSRGLSAAVRVVNPASRHVLEKCGFHHDGAGFRDFPARGGRLPVDLFTLERGIWASLKRWGPAVVVEGVRNDTALTAPLG
ncbi:MAG: GNAT family N-acetyltransferase [Chelatococcus sp.]|nr:GNAT family N-acetyltransferase [Chelatococcus sp. YT9]MBX3558355.1 GNAT family N-acetyltransferase [Chelatococcus sp.]